MAIYFFDTSAIVKRYVIEPGTAWVRTITAPAAGHSLYLCRITAVELAAAVTRRQRGGQLPAADAALVLTAFRQDVVLQYRLVELTASLLDRAAIVAETHGLRAYDAVQLAVAGELDAQRKTAGMSPLTVVSADQELNTAARVMGLAIEDPNAHP